MSNVIIKGQDLQPVCPEDLGPVGALVYWRAYPRDSMGC
jgi:hypothetical protein